MKTWLKRTLVGVAVSSALLGSLAAYSQGAGFHHGPASAEQMARHEARMLEHIGKRLNLDAAQAARLKTLGDLMVADHAPQAGADPHAAMAALIAGNTFDRAGAQQMVNRHLAKIQADSPALIAAAGDFFDSLDAAQQAQVREFAAHHHGFFGPGGFGPGDEHGHHGPHGASGAAGD